MRALQRIPQWAIALLLIAIPHLVFIISKWQQIPIHDGMPIGSSDPDPWLRLTLVREWLTSGNWYNHVVSNSNAPLGGIESPWTRPLDLVIAALTTLQPESVDLNLRLMRAALLLPWIWMVLLLIGSYRLVRLLTPLPSAYMMVSILLAAMPVTWNYFGLGNADHHAPLAALFIWAVYGVITPEPSRCLTILTGILFSLQLWISTEALILITLSYIWYGLNWLRGERNLAHPLPLLATTIAIATTIATMIELHPSKWLHPHYDTISIVYVAILTLAAMLAWFLWFTPAKSISTRITLAGIGSAALLTTLYLIYPAVYSGPLVDSDPFIFTDFLPRITEAKPLTSQLLPYVVGMLVQPIIALFLCAMPWLYPNRSFYNKTYALPLLFLLSTTLILYIGQQRWSYYLLPLLAVAIAPAMGMVFTPEHPAVRDRWPASVLNKLTPNQQMIRRLPIILLIVALPLGMMFVNVAYENRVESPTDRAQAERRSQCYKSARQLIYSGALDAMFGKPVVLLAPTDLGAEILFFTRHRIIASNYHREGAAIRYAWGAETITDPNKLRSYLKERQVEALLICPKIDPTADSVLQGLQGGTIKTPQWLKAISYTLPSHPTDDKPTPRDAAPAIYRVTG